MISYRRSDAAGIAGRIFDRLCAHFGSESVFMDVDAIPLGVDFRSYIESAMNAMDVLVAIVGPDWHATSATGSNRLLDPEDPVRLELEMATTKSLKIVPVLVEGASMPGKAAFPASLQHIAFLNAATVSTGLDFDHHVARLMRSLERHAGASAVAETSHAPPATGNLPKQRSALIGRERDVASLKTLVDRHDLVTITGAGGIGKTRIGLRVAADLRDARLDGAWLVDLAPLRAPGLIAAQIAATLGIAEFPGRSALETVMTYLQRRDLLLVVDNCEHVIEEAANVIEAILRSCQEVNIVATSRETLGISGEHVYALAPLTTPKPDVPFDATHALEYASVALFFERATAVNPHFSMEHGVAETVAEICRRLDGNALAIELAAARVTALSPAQINERLGERFDVLTEGSRTAAQRQQTLRATIDWSFDLLAQPERALLVALGIFADGWSLEAAEAVCADSDVDRKLVVDRLSSLVRKSLVAVDFQRESVRYRLLESTKAYAFEKSASVHAMLLQRLLAWIDRLTANFANEASAGDERTSLAEVKREIANIRLALDAAFNDGESAPSAARIIHRLAISMFWYDAGIESEGRSWVKRALAHAESSGDVLLKGKLWSALAGISVGREAVEAATKAVGILEGAGEPADGARAYTALAFGLFQLGRSEEAGIAAQTALELYERQAPASRHGYADALAVRANIFRETGRHEQARNAFVQAIDIFEKNGGKHGAGSARGNLAELEFFCGNARLALQLIDEAIRSFRDIGATSREATALVNAATYHLDLGEIEEARRTSLAALKLALDNGDVPIITVALQNISAVKAHCGELDSSARLIGYVDAWYRGEGYERQWSEQRVERLVTSIFSKAASRGTIAKQRVEGRSLSQDDAVREALLTSIGSA